MRVLLFNGLLVAALVASGCRPSSGTPRGAAERFLDQHYVRMDLQAAKEHCVGVARHKVEEELRLVGDQVIDESTRQPRVGYSLAEERVEGEDRVIFVYSGDIRLEGGERVAVRWLVTTRRQADGTWKVSNFQEFE